MTRDSIDVLEKLFHLNHWAKTGDVITRRDRDVLYEIKREQVEELNASKVLIPARRVERQNTTLCSLQADGWAGPVLDLALENDESSDDEDTLRQKLDEIYVSAVDSLKPLDIDSLEELCVGSLAFAVVGGYLEPNVEWKDIEYVIDPCWYWLIEFRTQEPLPRFCFHLPYRVAELFCAVGDITASDTNSRELGEKFGRPITEEESLAFPILELVQFFGRKESDFPNQLRIRDDIEREIIGNRRSSVRNDEWDDDEWEDDEWEDDEWDDDSDF